MNTRRFTEQQMIEAHRAGQASCSDFILEDSAIRYVDSLTPISTHGTVKSAEGQDEEYERLLVMEREFVKKLKMRQKELDELIEVYKGKTASQLPPNNEAMAQNFYCKGWEKDGSQCEEQCSSCKRTQSMPEAMAPQSQGAHRLRNEIAAMLNDFAFNLQENPAHSTDKYVNSILSLIGTQSEVDNGGWISVEEGVPDPYKWVIGGTNDDVYVDCFYKYVDGNFYGYGNTQPNVFIKRWMYAPIEGYPSSPGKPTQSGEAMEVLRGLVGYWNNDQLECTANEWFDDVYKLIDRARQLLSSPTPNIKEENK